MGLAVPSVVDASRRLPSSALPADSVKANGAGADDALVTSVAIAPPAIDEPVSPELALVDPELAARLRALLPVVELEPPPPPLLRALPDPELDDLPVAPPPELVAPEQLAAAPVIERVPVFVFPTRGDRIRSFAKAFAVGAAVATVVTVGVVAELGEGPAAQDPGTTPPRLAAPAPAGTAGANADRQPKSSKPAAAAGRSGKRASEPQAPTKKPKPSAKPRGRAAAPAAGGGTTKPGAKQSKRATGAAAEPRRFAWAPVDGAVGYRLELFRGNEQVLVARTKLPAYELAPRWRHGGHDESLTGGSYRWYVWPVLPSGPADTAVVQANLTIP
jgi:hypothetical protein